MITPDDLDKEIRAIVDLAGLDSPPAPQINFSTGSPRDVARSRSMFGVAAALALVAAGIIALTSQRNNHDNTTVMPAESSAATVKPPHEPSTTASGVALADEAIATLQIPALNLSTPVYPNVDQQSLAQGAGHLPGTSRPGELGNSVIEGHRTPYGAEFLDLDQLSTGDRIVITTSTGDRYEYVVAATYTEAPDADLGLPAAADRASLTLYTCAPKYTARLRLTVYSELDITTSDTPRTPVTEQSTPRETDENALPC